MAIPSVGGGQQIGDGNLNELKIGVMPAPQTATSTATLTTAQILGGVLVGDPSTSAASYTLPTVADTEAVLVNAKVGSTFDLHVINLGTSSGIITMVVGTGWTLSGMVTLPITTLAGSSGLFRARKTGTGAWTMYRVS
jgi:hypothetical protein